MKKLLFCLTTCLLAGTSAHGSRIPQAAAVRAILGESLNQSAKTQLLLAVALRHRATLQGVYGVNNPVVATASAAARAQATRAWQLSALPANNALLPARCRYFGCPGDAPYFASIGLKPVCRSGSITFYQ